ncbi:MAG: hypothetical protein ACREDW_11005 [Aestuariivirgaceae bacterium]
MLGRPVIEGSQAAIPSLEKSGAGAIINIGSIAATTAAVLASLMP